EWRRLGWVRWRCRRLLEWGNGGGGSDCGDGCDMVVAAAMKMVRRLRWWGGGGNGVKAVVVVACDGEWHGGSNRS
nr:hypothetical protein [Tanacetum cinerariifolium]